jgi:hypothetical protein
MKYRYVAALAVAATAFVAWIGAGTASATVLCKTNTNPCSSPYPKGTVFSGELTGNAVFHSVIGNFECTKGSGSVETTSSGSATETVKGVTKTLTFGGCNTEIVVLTPGAGGEIHWISGTSNGNFTAEGVQVTSVASGFHCIWGGTVSHAFTFTGGENPTGDSNATIARIGGRSGAFCGSSLEVTGSGVLTSPKPVYVKES